MAKKEVLLGAHMSISGGLYKAIERGESIGCTTIQLFTKSNKQWYAKKLTDEDINLFKETLKASSLSKKIMVHSAYLINLASKNPDIVRKSITSLTHELERCELLDIPYLVLHPGAHTGRGEEEGITKITEGLDKVFSAVPGESMILLETSAGQGTSLGHTLKQLRDIYDQSSHKDRIGICVDTCHIFSAGYDISTPSGYNAFWDEYLKVLGIRLLKAIHLNDSKVACAARVDRHQKIGKGTIPLATFRLLMNDERFDSVPKILETPIIKDYLEEYQTELELLNSLIKT